MRIQKDSEVQKEKDAKYSTEQLQVPQSRWDISLRLTQVSHGA